MQLMSEALAQQAQGHRTNLPLNVAHFVAARDLFSQEAPGLRDVALAGMLPRDFAGANANWKRGPVLFPGSDVKGIARTMSSIQGGLDAAIIVLGNYGCEKEVEALLRELDVPALIVAPTDGPPDPGTGRRLYDAFCGVQPMTKLVADRGHPYLVAPHAALESEATHQAIDRFLRAARAVRNVTGDTLLCIGTPSPTFDAIKVSELALNSQFNTTVEWVELHTHLKMIDKLLATEQAMLGAEVHAIGQRVDIKEVPTEAMLQIAAAKIAMLQLLVEKKADGITHRCWPEIVKDRHLMHCAPSGDILNLGEGIACETDLTGLKSVLMLKGFGLGRPPIFADVTIAIPVTADGRPAGPGDEITGWIILVWHCGPFASSLCRDCVLQQGWIIPTDDGEPAWAILDGVIDAPGEMITLARFGAYGPNGDNFSFNVLEMPLVEGPKTIGTHGYGYIAGDDAFQQLYQRLTMGEREWGVSDTVHHFGGVVAPSGVGDLVMDVARLIQRPFRTLGPDEDELLARRRCKGFHPLTPWQPA